MLYECGMNFSTVLQALAFTDSSINKGFIIIIIIDQAV